MTPRRRYLALLGGLTIVLLAGATAGLALGSVRIPAHQGVGPSSPAPPKPGPHRTIVLEVRAPRVVLGAVTGAGLAVIGTTLQALVRNPARRPLPARASPAEPPPGPSP